MLHQSIFYTPYLPIIRVFLKYTCYLNMIPFHSIYQNKYFPLNVPEL